MDQRYQVTEQNSHNYEYNDKGIIFLHDDLPFDTHDAHQTPHTSIILMTNFAIKNVIKWGSDGESRMRDRISIMRV